VKDKKKLFHPGAQATGVSILPTAPSNPSLEIDALLTPAETAERLRTTPGVLATWRCTKRVDLKFVKVGARVFYRASTVQKFIEERETLETSHPKKAAVRL